MKWWQVIASGQIEIAFYFGCYLTTTTTKKKQKQKYN